MMWEHPTSLLAAPSNTYIGQTAPLFRAPLNTHTSNCAALFRNPALQSQFILTNHRPVCSNQSQTTHQPSKPNKRRPPGASKTSSFLLIQTCTTRLRSINIVTVGELKLLFQATLQYPTMVLHILHTHSPTGSGLHGCNTHHTHTNENTLHT